jgi:hypothetical protein
VIRIYCDFCVYTYLLYFVRKGSKCSCEFIFLLSERLQWQGWYRFLHIGDTVLAETETVLTGGGGFKSFFSR